MPQRKAQLKINKNLGEGGGVQDRGHMYACGQFILMYGNIHLNIVQFRYCTSQFGP